MRTGGVPVPAIHHEMWDLVMLFQPYTVKRETLCSFHTWETPCSSPTTTNCETWAWDLRSSVQVLIHHHAEMTWGVLPTGCSSSHHTMWDLRRPSGVPAILLPCLWAVSCELWDLRPGIPAMFGTMRPKQTQCFSHIHHRPGVFQVPVMHPLRVGPVCCVQAIVHY